VILEACHDTPLSRLDIPAKFINVVVARLVRRQPAFTHLLHLRNTLSRQLRFVLTEAGRDSTTSRLHVSTESIDVRPAWAVPVLRARRLREKQHCYRGHYWQRPHHLHALPSFFMVATACAPENFPVFVNRQYHTSRAATGVRCEAVVVGAFEPVAALNRETVTHWRL